MTKDDILAGNKVMAEYLGYKYFPHTEPYGKDSIVGWVNTRLSFKNPHFYLCRSHRDLPFYNDWNALMRVVDKLESGEVVVSIVKNSIAIHNYHEVYASMNGEIDKLKSTWAVCLQYLNRLKQ